MAARAPEVHNLKLAAEERWAFDRWREGMPFREMEELAPRPVEWGGLGYSLSKPTLIKRAKDYRTAWAAENDATRDEWRAKELEDLNAQQRALVSFLDPVDRAASAPVAHALGLNVDELLANPRYERLVVLRDDKVRITALAQLREVGVQRRKLLGLDAPIEVSVTTSTATEAAIAELEAQLGKTPQPTPREATQ